MYVHDTCIIHDNSAWGGIYIFIKAIVLDIYIYNIQDLTEVSTPPIFFKYFIDIFSCDNTEEDTLLQM